MSIRRVCVILGMMLVLGVEVLCFMKKDGCGESDGVENSHGYGVTKRENRLLNRKKRYLTFPMGSAFIMTISLIKSLMIKTPTGLRLAAECDVPFALPSDTRSLRQRGGVRQRQKREIYDQIAVAFQGLGFNGTACVRRAICDARGYAPLNGASLVRDLLMALFNFDEAREYLTHCKDETYDNCDMPLLNYIEGLIRTGEGM